MPNLNLKGDAPDEIPEMSDAPESEQTGTDSGGSWKRMLPLGAGALIALLLAAYILNKTGVVHLWGNKKASSVMVVSEPVDTASQALTDSAMAEQFRKDSLEAVGTAVGAPKKNDAKHQTVDAAKMKDAKQPAIAAAKKSQEKKAAEETKKPAVETKKPAAKAPAANEYRNMTTVEVPGAAQRRAASASDEEQDRARRAAASQQEHARMSAEQTAPKSPAVRQPRETGHAAAGTDAQHKTAPRQQTPPKSESAAPKSESAAGYAAKPKGTGKYTVQISSWTSVSKARAFAQRFTEAGIPAFIVTEGGIHRVCTGRFATQAAAEARAEELVPMLEKKYDIIILK